MTTPRKTIIVPTAPAGGKERPFETGLLLNFNQERRGGMAVEILLVMEKKDGRSYQRIPLSGHHYEAYLTAFAPAVRSVLRQLTDEALLQCLVRGGYAWLQDADRPFERLDGRHFALLREWVGSVLQEFRPLAPAIRHLYYLPAGEAFFSYAVRPAAISASSPGLQFRLERSGIRLALRGSVRVDHGVFPLEDFQAGTYFLKSGNEFFVLSREDREVLERLREGEYQVREEGLPRFLATVLKPLAERYAVDLSEVIRTERIDELPEGRVYVSELNENFLLIKPRWQYADLEVEDSEETETRIEGEGRVWLIRRNREEEGKLKEVLRSLHPKFAAQDNGYYYLNFKEALEKGWFLRFYSRMQEMDIPVLGMNKLRKFKYNTNKPVFEALAGKGIDWFDLTIRVSYGDQTVPLHELRQAILGKQDFILLADGSLGVLPKEWAGKYGLLLRMGQERSGTLRLPALHWAVLEETGLGSDAIQRELEEKRRRWEAVEREGTPWLAATGANPTETAPGATPPVTATGATPPVPQAVRATLRDYQLGGFKWMCLLDEMGWGGCLADDMGLGKTLQTLSFLRHLAAKYPQETHLVVCPTSLLYNWETEIGKFVPDLPRHIYYGPARFLDDETFRTTRVVLTSYGLLRSDIRELALRRWGYVILDESQAIKNPASQARKAVQQLQARNRLALSGTPVQNSTFDLFAQMDFLNPGMLGSQEFFRTQFANPVDRNGDKEASARLRKLVYPFILRRTKEQVARDLPDKTEMILWCEMGEEQRKVYERFKDSYRSALLDRIGEEGMGRSAIYILEGLTRLRQICDHPLLAKEEGPSAKLEELIREIDENTGHHKALVFSQFTSMLQLIREALDERGIPYLYLDGSVSAGERKQAVSQFQEEDETRIFLISLKAGGVGLTLTAADYVYLVDPWWNPAAEQQAIDRSHRIGQDKKVFAYRMICRDSVEEKIMQLQEKKRSLASDLIPDESAFVKQLTREDVDYLFS